MVEKMVLCSISMPVTIVKIIIIATFCQVVFELSDATERQFRPNSFNAIYSRDTILHIEVNFKFIQILKLYKEKRKRKKRV